MLEKIKFSISPPGGDRVHHVSEPDILVVLSRLPEEEYNRLKGVHFNDRAWGNRVLGYVNRGRREIALCALPPRMSLTRALTKGQKPEHFGAIRGTQWPVLAIRRFLLYDVFYTSWGTCRSSTLKPKAPKENSRGKGKLRSLRCAGTGKCGPRPSTTPTRCTTRPLRTRSKPCASKPPATAPLE